MAGTCGYGKELSDTIKAGNFLTSGKVYWLASQEGLSSMEYVSKCCNHSILVHDIQFLVSHWPPSSEIGMRLIRTSWNSAW